LRLAGTKDAIIRVECANEVNEATWSGAAHRHEAIQDVIRIQRKRELASPMEYVLPKQRRS
jgi:hypothetical protein